MLNNDLFFQTITALAVPFIVAIIVATADKVGFIWAKINQPSIAALIGGLVGAVYHIEAVYSQLHGRLPQESLADFIGAGIIAGLAAAGVKSIFKDATTGAMTTNSPEGVMRMRERNGSGDGIGA